MPALTIPVALAIAGGASAGAQIYATKRNADINKRSLEASERSDERALAFEREDAARRERAYTQALDMDRQRWADYTRIMEPHWRVGATALGSLYDLAGYSGDAPAMAPSSGTPSGQPPALPSSAAPMSGYGRAAAARRVAGVRRPAMAPPPLPAESGGLPLMDLMALGQQARAFTAPTPTAGLPSLMLLPSA